MDFAYWWSLQPARQACFIKCLPFFSLKLTTLTDLTKTLFVIILWFTVSCHSHNIEIVRWGLDEKVRSDKLWHLFKDLRYQIKGYTFEFELVICWSLLLTQPTKSSLSHLCNSLLGRTEAVMIACSFTVSRPPPPNPWIAIVCLQFQHSYHQLHFQELIFSSLPLWSRVATSAASSPLSSPPGCREETEDNSQEHHRGLRT